jgi:hypothetical protein
MTGATQDVIFYAGDDHLVSPGPLETYMTLPRFEAYGAANSRGYTAGWTVIVDRLFLVSLSGWAEGAAEPGVRTVFPTAEAPVFAQWFTGELLLQSGKRLTPSGPDSLYELEIVLYVLSGRIQSKRRLERRSRPGYLDPVLARPVGELDTVDPHILYALETSQFRTVGALTQTSALVVMHKARLDLAAIFELEHALAQWGLSFGMDGPY